MISDIHPRRLEEAVAKLKEETGLAEIYGQLCNVTIEEDVSLVAVAEPGWAVWTCSSTTPAWVARSGVQWT